MEQTFSEGICRIFEVTLGKRNMIKPITPNDVVKVVPDEVIEVFNLIIQEKWDGKKSVIKQSKAASRSPCISMA